jgi:hypothetical protein
VFALLWLLPSLTPGYGDAASLTLRTELADLEEAKSRFLIDFYDSRGSEYRLMYVANRRISDPQLQPEAWSVGLASPLLTAGPVSLRGALAQLYNPLAHGPGSEVFSEAAGLSLDINLDLARRRGVQLGIIPQCFSFIGVYKQQNGMQIGCLAAVPVGQRAEFALVGLLSAPPDQLEDEAEGAWYADEPNFPGGPLSHLAGSLKWESTPLRLHLAAAASGGQRIGPGTLVTLHISRTASQRELDLLMGYCSAGYFSPEGNSSDPEWLAAARIRREFGFVHLSASCQKEISHLTSVPKVYRESRDHLTAGVEFIRHTDSSRGWSIAGDAALQRAWSSTGDRQEHSSLEVETILDWHRWRFVVGMDEGWSSVSERYRDISLLVSYDPTWGEAKLAMGYQVIPATGFHLAAAIEAKGEYKRIFARLETREILPFGMEGNGRQTEDWLKLFTLCVGWEVKSGRP